MLEALQNSPALALIAAAVFGLIVGSFLNVVIHRVPVMLEREWAEQAAEYMRSTAPQAGEPSASPADPSVAHGIGTTPEGAHPAATPHSRYNLLTPRSQCPSCGHVIRASENIPVLSWIRQRGRCTACRWPIPLRYPLIELTTALLFVLAVLHFGASAMALSAIVLSAFLLALTAIDLDTQLLPDNITLPLLWIGLILNLDGLFTPLHSAVIGALAGYLSLWSLYWLFRLTTGKEGMGYGDFKLFAALGAWFGWQTLPTILLLASIVGAIVGLGLIFLKGRERSAPIPFGPYLAGAGLATLYFRDLFAALWIPA